MHTIFGGICLSLVEKVARYDTIDKLSTCYTTVMLLRKAFIYRIAPDLMERRRNHHVVCGQLSVDVDTNHSN